MKESCQRCGDETGHAGRGEDSLFCDDCDLGPFCRPCWDIHVWKHAKADAVARVRAACQYAKTLHKEGRYCSECGPWTGAIEGGDDGN